MTLGDDNDQFLTARISCGTFLVDGEEGQMSTSRLHVVAKLRSNRAALLLAAVLFAAVSHTAEPAASAPTFTIRVTLPDGSPAAGVPVQVVGLERVGRHNRPAGATGKDGALTVQVVRGPRDRDAHDVGYGLYRFVTMPRENAWQVSDILHWNESAEDVEGAAEPGPGRSLGGFPTLEHYKELVADRTTNRGSTSNWAHAKVVPISFGEDVEWKVRLDPGAPMTVRVLDQFDAPIPDMELTVGLDLEALTHTGLGGFVKMAEVRTDAEGVFVLEHVGDFVYTFSHSGYFSYYAPGMPYRTGDVRHHLRKQGSVVRYTREAGRRIAVRVVEAGTLKPIPDATVGQVLYFNSTAQGGPMGKTGPDGRFSTDKACTDHVQGGFVEKVGYEPERFDMDAAAGQEEFYVALSPLAGDTEAASGRE
jgi:hypothetical protein